MSAPDQPSENLALVRVTVHAPGGVHYPGDAVVRLRGQDGGAIVALHRKPGLPIYEAMVAPGRYTLEVDADDWTAPPRVMAVGARGKTAAVYLGRAGWPAFRMGETIVPFEPHDELVAIAFASEKPDPSVNNSLVQELETHLKLKPVATSANEEQAFTVANGSAVVLELPESDGRESVLPEIPKFLTGARNARIGLPVDITPRQYKILDDRYVVRFRDSVAPDKVDALLVAANATKLRDFIQAPNAWLIKFASGDYREQLQTIEDWFAQELLVYGEPDLLVEIVDDAFPVDDPNDQQYPDQENLVLQGVKEAWQFLHDKVNAEWTLGNPAIRIATLDSGIEPDHPDVGKELTDGELQIAACFDFSRMQPCSAPGYRPASNHGIGVYGIIAARTDNEETLIAGIAPNTRQLALQRPDLASSMLYADVLLWVAGFETGNNARGEPAGWPDEPIATPAHIINCSHAQKGLPLSGLVDDAFRFLTTHGRDGLGIVLVYGAGNDSSCITRDLVFAAHPCTLAIANSKAPDDDDGCERHAANSNWGPELDICARGSDVWSLDLGGDKQRFGGTSAAAPTVAAAVALMLTANPNLTWIEVRTILRDTAEKIDPENDSVEGRWNNDGFSQRYGYGRLNAAKAVKSARNSFA
ncbi:MAG: hypothetical protein K0S99_2983 [Thermomicrobiales bacterium]|nr:hypothetical protein [Thermomicrobiales bacterium]